MGRKNRKNEDMETVKNVLVIMASLFFGIILWCVLFNLFSMLSLVYFDEPIREIKNFLYNTEASGIGTAEKSLQEKYGEEFIIHDVYPKASHEFFAECSPVSNEEVVFKAAIWKDGSGVVYDDYISGSVAKELEKEIEGELGKYYDSVFVQVYPMQAGGRHTEIDSVKDMSLEEYVKRFSPGWCRIEIGIDAKEESEHLEEEYAFYESMQKKVSDKEIPPIDVYYYNMDAELQEWCNDYFTQYSTAYGTYTEKRVKCNKMEFECTVEGISITYDEFKTMREELSNNEGGIE